MNHSYGKGFLTHDRAIGRNLRGPVNSNGKSNSIETELMYYMRRDGKTGFMLKRLVKKVELSMPQNTFQLRYLKFSCHLW